MDAFGMKEAWKNRRGWDSDFSRRANRCDVEGWLGRICGYTKIKEARLSWIVDQLVTVSSRCKPEVIVLAGSPLVVEIDCPAMHLQEVEGDVGGSVDL